MSSRRGFVLEEDEDCSLCPASDEDEDVTRYGFIMLGGTIGDHLADLSIINAPKCGRDIYDNDDRGKTGTKFKNNIYRHESMK